MVDIELGWDLEIRISDLGAQVVKAWARGEPQGLQGAIFNVNVMNVDTIEGSQVQQGTDASSQTAGKRE